MGSCMFWHNLTVARCAQRARYRSRATMRDLRAKNRASEFILKAWVVWYKSNVFRSVFQCWIEINKNWNNRTLSFRVIREKRREMTYFPTLLTAVPFEFWCWFLVRPGASFVLFRTHINLWGYGNFWNVPLYFPIFWGLFRHFTTTTKQACKWELCMDYFWCGYRHQIN